MAKNKKFKKHYIIAVEGITTNEFALDFMDRAIEGFVKALDIQFRQVTVRMVSDHAREASKA